MKNPEGTKKEPMWDLGFNYYEDYKGGPRFLGARKEWKFCNLRTREVFNERHHRVNTKGRPRPVRGRTVPGDETPLFLSEEKVYRCSVWLRRDFEIIPKSSEPDYIGSIDDWAFSAKLREIDGGEIKSIADEYREAKKRYEKWVNGYPYMDEFEYHSSKFDED